MPTKKPKPTHIEDSLQALETVVDTLTQGQLCLDETLKQYELGIKLVRQCHQTLQTAQQKVSRLHADTLVDFDDIMTPDSTHLNDDNHHDDN